MKVAIATQDMKTADAHFAGARNLAIYEVSPQGSRLVEAVRFDATSDQSGEHSQEEHLTRVNARIDAIKGCALLFVRAIGGPAAARVVNSRIHPIKLQRDEPISEVLDRVQTMLNGNPPPWLRKVLQQESGEPAGVLAGEALAGEEPR